jgi:long-chain acyl-CoA synthetase
MKGYWNQPQTTASAIDPDGWFHSGDIGRIDDEGFLFIVDRLKDLIIRGGYNVYPREVEAVLESHPGVREVAVVGVADDRLGEEIAAVVVLEDGAVVDAADLQDFVKERVAPYKYPRYVWIVDALPHGPTGKLRKRDISLPLARR